MIGQPKYDIGDIVSFEFGNPPKPITGTVEIVDAYGTFEQNDEPSYDIMVNDFEGNRCLFKHIREQYVKLIQRG